MVVHVAEEVERVLMQIMRRLEDIVHGVLDWSEYVRDVNWSKCRREGHGACRTVLEHLIVEGSLPGHLFSGDTMMFTIVRVLDLPRCSPLILSDCESL